MGKWFWLSWFVSGFIFEMIAIITGKVAWTLSYQLWYIRHNSKSFFGFIIAIWGWAAYHFIVDGKDYFKDLIK